MPSEQLDGIVAQHLTRLRSLLIDGVIIYDIQDKAEPISTPRPFQFLPTIDPDVYAREMETLRDPRSGGSGGAGRVRRG
jgi:hypothetical protein